MSVSDVICPRCQNRVSQERALEMIVVCNHCGFTSKEYETKLTGRAERTYVKGVILASIIMVLGFAHVVNWDKHWLTVIPLKSKQILGQASVKELYKLSVICKDRMKHSCVESTLKDLVAVDPNDLSALESLANIQRQLGKLDQASVSYGQYFERGGDLHVAAYHYAQVLQGLGRSDEALEYYDKALKLNPGEIQVTVTESYVELLMSLRKYREAKRVIDRIRRSSVAARHFMSREYEEIQQMI